MDLHDPNNKCGRTQQLLWTRQWSTGNYRSVETSRVKIKINNNYDIHKTQLYILNKIILNLNTIQILAVTKYWCQQNIGAEYWRWQNTRVDRIYCRRQNTGVDKILASTKYWCRQNIGVVKILASTKCWQTQTQKDLLTVWLGRVHSCWLLPDLAEDLPRLTDGIDPFACSCQVSHFFWPLCFYGRTLSRTVPAYFTGHAATLFIYFYINLADIQNCIYTTRSAPLLLSSLLSARGAGRKPCRMYSLSPYSPQFQ